MLHLNLCSNKLHLLSDTALEARTASIVVNGDDKAISCPFLKNRLQAVMVKESKKYIVMKSKRHILTYFQAMVQPIV